MCILQKQCCEANNEITDVFGGHLAFFIPVRTYKPTSKFLIDSQLKPQICLISSTATKYFGGHSDLLAGIIIVKTQDDWKAVRPIDHEDSGEFWTHDTLVALV